MRLTKAHAKTAWAFSFTRRVKNIHNLQSAAYENAVILLNTSEKTGGLCITEQKWREYRSQRWKRLECEIYSHAKTVESENQQEDSVL